MLHRKLSKLSLSNDKESEAKKYSIKTLTRDASLATKAMTRDV